MRDVIFLAPPATGKGTLSKYLVDKYKYTHISTGNLLRKVAKEDTEIGHIVASLMKNGKYISNDIVLPIVKEELMKLNGKPFILDGIPRTKVQADYMDKLLSELNVDNYVVINIEIAEENLKKRSTGRRICSKCAATYNIYFDEFKPKNENVCDHCNSSLIEREDDNEETFNERIKIYLEETSPLIDFYKSKGKLVSLNANQTNEQIMADLDKLIGE